MSRTPTLFVTDCICHKKGGDSHFSPITLQKDTFLYAVCTKLQLALSWRYDCIWQSTTRAYKMSSFPEHINTSSTRKVTETLSPGQSVFSQADTEGIVGKWFLKPSSLDGCYLVKVFSFYWSRKSRRADGKQTCFNRTSTKMANRQSISPFTQYSAKTCAVMKRIDDLVFLLTTFTITLGSACSGHRNDIRHLLNWFNPTTIWAEKQR